MQFCFSVRCPPPTLCWTGWESGRRAGSLPRVAGSDTGGTPPSPSTPNVSVLASVIYSTLTSRGRIWTMLTSRGRIWTMPTSRPTSLIGWRRVGGATTQSNAFVIFLHISCQCNKTIKVLKYTEQHVMFVLYRYKTRNSGRFTPLFLSSAVDWIIKSLTWFINHGFFGVFFYVPAFGF